MNTLPQSVRGALWSYDIEQLDKDRDKDRIITNVLNFGTREATEWLFSSYPRDVIASVIMHPKPGEWNKKSLNLWATVFGVIPVTRTRFS